MRFVRPSGRASYPRGLRLVDTCAISCTGTRVANRASVAGDGAGPVRGGGVLGDEPPGPGLDGDQGQRPRPPPGQERRRGTGTGPRIKLRRLGLVPRFPTSPSVAGSVL
jgi:hypothetical protein